MEENALIIMAKAPEKNSVKTRLAKYLSDKQRVKLYIVLLTNTIYRLKAMKGVETFICHAPESAHEYFSQFGLKKFSQSEGDIGERMFSAINYVLDKGYEKAVLVGTDVPELSAEIVSRAFDLLSLCDTVFGPTEDGGYYLIGLKRPHREIFVDIKWSTEYTLKESVDKAEALGLSVDYTEMLSDIDTVEDVHKASHLFGNIFR